jgi:hypothetical protein
MRLIAYIIGFIILSPLLFLHSVSSGLIGDFFPLMRILLYAAFIKD